MGLFDKKYCDICGQKIGLLGNRKLEDGNLCKECAKKLSPWFSDRRNSTVEEIKAQLTYRENNKKEVALMKPTLILGENTYQVYIDEAKQKFFVTRSRKWQDENPDIFNISDVADVRVEVSESKDEIFDEDEEGKSISFNPPRYEYEYRFDVLIRLNHPFVDEIEYELTATRPDSPYTEAYRGYEKLADDLMMALINRHYSASNDFEYQEEEKEDEVASDTWTCKCGSKNDGAFCPNCGSAKPTPIAFCSNCGAKIADPANPPKFCSACGHKLV